jgi:hypothetical protein
LVLHLIKVERPACSDGGAGEDGGDWVEPRGFGRST